MARAGSWGGRKYTGAHQHSERPLLGRFPSKHLQSLSHFIPIAILLLHFADSETEA